MDNDAILDMLAEPLFAEDFPMMEEASPDLLDDMPQELVEEAAAANRFFNQ